MKTELKKLLAVAFFTTVLAVCSAPVYGYVLQGPHILDLMVENLGKAKSLFVSQKLILYGVDSVTDSGEHTGAGDAQRLQIGADASRAVSPTGDRIAGETAEGQASLEFEGSLRFAFSSAFRSDVKSPGSERIFIFNAGQTLTLVDGNRVAGAENRFDLFKDLLLYHSREALVDRLVRLGVDVSVSSLGRFEEKIAFVIGAQYPDTSVSQVWIDRDTFLPIRWIIKGVNLASESDTLEIRYLVWWKIGKTRYPSRIEFYQDGNLARVDQAVNFEEDATFSEALFDIDYLKTIYPPASVLPIVPGEPDEPSEVEKTIEEFKRIYE